MKQGTDNMTAAEEKLCHVPATEEEEWLSSAIEAELRDVLSDSGSEMNMGRTRPTDMRNNREVRMPGAGQTHAGG